MWCVWGGGGECVGGGGGGVGLWVSDFFVRVSGLVPRVIESAVEDAI